MLSTGSIIVVRRTGAVEFVEDVDELFDVGVARLLISSVAECTQTLRYTVTHTQLAPTNTHYEHQGLIKDRASFTIFILYQPQKVDVSCGSFRVRFDI